MFAKAKVKWGPCQKPPRRNVARILLGRAAFAGSSSANDVSQSRCCKVQTGLAVRERSDDTGPATSLSHD